MNNQFKLLKKKGLYQERTKRGNSLFIAGYDWRQYLVTYGTIAALLYWIFIVNLVLCCKVIHWKVIMILCWLILLIGVFWCWRIDNVGSYMLQWSKVFKVFHPSCGYLYLRVPRYIICDFSPWFLKRIKSWAFTPIP